MVLAQGHQNAKKGCVTLTCNHSAKRAGNLNRKGKILINGEGLKDCRVFAQGTARATSSKYIEMKRYFGVKGRFTQKQANALTQCEYLSKGFSPRIILNMLSVQI